MLSRSCIYAIKIMIYLALQQKHGTGYVGVSAVSEAIDSPRHFTAKILQQLSKAKLIASQRGPNGGFYLSAESEVSLADIVRVIDGNELFDGCILGFKECSDLRPCPAHQKFKSVRDHVKGALLTTRVEELRQIVEDEHGFLKF